jgi:hypothetical protein
MPELLAALGAFVHLSHSLVTIPGSTAIERARNRVIPLPFVWWSKACCLLPGRVPQKGGDARMSPDVLWWLGVFLSLFAVAVVAWIFNDFDD